MEEKPITDKDNFPKPPDGEEMRTMFVPASALLPGAAYNEGCADGYRKAMLDIMIWSMALILCLKLLPSLSRS
jgi:hypothetical protein